MGAKKRLIIPIFIPFAGCRHRCVFCNQTEITGQHNRADTAMIMKTIEAYLSTWKGGGVKEVAFYGGTFTALPVDLQSMYLSSVAGYVFEGRIDAVRVSTRPDCIGETTPVFLKNNHVRTVELGAQSMSDEVLKLSGRGHTAADTAEAVRLLRINGLKVGLQLMPGLPGDTEETVLDTASRVISLGPDFVRIYPTIVVQGTPLEKMYFRGEYATWGLTEMVELSAEILRLFVKAGIPVIRMGLRHSEEFSRSVVAGPYHPSFRSLVEEAVRTKAGAA